MATILVSFDEYYPSEGQLQQSLLVLMNITPLKDNGNQQSLLVLMNIIPLKDNGNNHC